MINKKGMTAVFLMMILAGMLTVVLVLLEGACYVAGKSSSEAICDLAGRSVLSSYHRKLKDDYGIFGLYAQEEQIKEELSYYINAATKEDKMGGEGTHIKLIDLSLDELSADASEWILLRPQVMERQIMDYMKYRALWQGTQMLDQEEALGEDLKKSKDSMEFVKEKTKEAAQAEERQAQEDEKTAQMQEAGGQEPDGQEAGGQEPDGQEAGSQAPDEQEALEEQQRSREKERLSTMLQRQKYRNSGEKKRTEGEEQRVLRNEQIKRTLPSEIVEYQSMPELQKTLSKNPKELLLSGRDSLYLDEYILLQFSNRANKRSEKDTFFQNEVEYILCGHDGDARNEKQMRVYLFTLRTALNLAHIYGDTQKRQLTLEAALAITPGPAAPATQLLIATLWAGGESEQDISDLFQGRRVPFMKKKSDWKLDLDYVLSGGQLREAKKTEHKAEEGAGSHYEDYLRFFLFLSGRECRLVRLMDLIQLNVQLRYEKDFRLMDYCGGFSYRAEFSRRSVLRSSHPLAGGGTVEKVQSY